MENQTPQQGSIFINGKEQIIDMLKFMTNEEKMKLVKNMYARNPQLANELFEKSLDFESITQLTDDDIQRVIGYINPQVMGVALKGVPQNTQRRILTLCQRAYAEKAFNVMTTPLRNEGRDIDRAQERVIETMISLAKKKIIRLVAH